MQFKGIFLIVIVCLIAFLILTFYHLYFKPKPYISLREVYTNLDVSSQTLNESVVRVKGKVLTVFEIPSLGVFIENEGFTVPVENISRVYGRGDVIEVEGKILFYSGGFAPVITSTKDTYLTHVELENLTYPTKRINEVNGSEIGKVIKIVGVKIRDIKKNIMPITNYTLVVFDGWGGTCYAECENLELGSYHNLIGTFIGPFRFRVLIVL
jgi:hypothetical protein